VSTSLTQTTFVNSHIFLYERKIKEIEVKKIEPKRVAYAECIIQAEDPCRAANHTVKVVCGT
jgi:hypothetical protein